MIPTEIGRSRTFSATLPAPPSVNHMYRPAYGRYGSVTRVCLTAEALSWRQTAALELRRQGFRPLRRGSYWLAITCALWTVRHDADNVLKIVIDAVANELEVDDACVGALGLTKIRVPRREDQRIEVRVLARPVANAAEWDALAASMIEGAPSALRNAGVVTVK